MKQVLIADYSHNGTDPFMKTNRATLDSGLDQLFFSPLVEGETVQDRADAIETFLKSNNATWDDVISISDKESN